MYIWGIYVEEAIEQRTETTTRTGTHSPFREGIN